VTESLQYVNKRYVVGDLGDLSKPNLRVHMFTSHRVPCFIFTTVILQELLQDKLARLVKTAEPGDTQQMRAVCGDDTVIKLVYISNFPRHQSIQIWCDFVVIYFWQHKNSRKQQLAKTWELFCTFPDPDSTRQYPLCRLLLSLTSTEPPSLV
jgi:hypothetical protein